MILALVIAGGLSVSGRASANPSIAARGNFVVVTWSAATMNAMDIYAAVSRDGGHKFSAPTRVNAEPGDARVGSENPPRVALVAHANRNIPDIVVVWTTKAASGTRLLFARSTDGGKSFGPNTTVAGSDAAGNRGWESVAVDSKGKVFALWLDHRTTPGQLMSNSLVGGAATSIAKGVCYCCKTSFVSAGNSLYGVWRHVYDDNERDIAFTTSHDDGRTFSAPVRVSVDNWHIDGCPENGPAIAVDRTRTVHVVWPTSPDGKNGTQLTLFYARSVDGKRFSERVHLPTDGPAAHVQIIMMPDGKPMVAWDEVVNGTRRLARARMKGNEFVRVNTPSTTSDEGWPVMAAVGNGILTAWVSGTGVGNSIQLATTR